MPLGFLAQIEDRITSAKKIVSAVTAASSTQVGNDWPGILLSAICNPLGQGNATSCREKPAI